MGNPLDLSSTKIQLSYKKTLYEMAHYLMFSRKYSEFQNVITQFATVIYTIV